MSAKAKLSYPSLFDHFLPLKKTNPQLGTVILSPFLKQCLIKKKEQGCKQKILEVATTFKFHIIKAREPHFFFIPLPLVWTVIASAFSRIT